jgi:hypothetical protein
MTRSPVLWFILSLVALAFLTAFAPLEKTLGANARIVYLHGVWVWAAMAAFFVAAGIGAIALLTGSQNLHRWSLAFGRTGLTFWITYLPISMWAMQTSWNGLFLAEPRWRLAVIFSIGGLLLQIGLTLLENPRWASMGNLVYLVLLLFALNNTQNVMHPPSPILNSDAARIQFYFGALLLVTLFAAGQVARWWRQFDYSRSSEALH